MPAPLYTDKPTLKLALNINTSDTARDSLLDTALKGAARAIYRRTGQRRFDKDAAPTTRILFTEGRVVWDRALCRFRLMVPDIATDTGLLVQDETGTVNYDFEVVYPDDPAYPITDLARGAWPRKVKLTARFGWPEVPEDIVQAHLLQAMRYYRRKDSPEGIAGSAEWGLVRVPRIDPDVEEMIQDYCFPAVA
jgi:hypothetical protein